MHLSMPLAGGCYSQSSRSPALTNGEIHRPCSIKFHHNRRECLGLKITTLGFSALFDASSRAGIADVDRPL